jgi:hypothetical protein
VARRESPLSEAALNGVSVFGFKGFQAGVEELSLRYDHEIESGSELVLSKNLANQSFCSISSDGSTKPARRRDAQPGARERVRQHEHRRISTVHLEPEIVDPLEVCPPPEML